MPPLPDSMRFLGTGWWWLHGVGAVGLFCFGWYHGQQRAERKFLQMQAERDAQQRPANPNADPDETQA